MENKDKIIIGSLIGFGLVATGAFLYLLITNRKQEDQQQPHQMPKTLESNLNPQKTKCSHQVQTSKVNEEQTQVKQPEQGTALKQKKKDT